MCKLINNKKGSAVVSAMMYIAVIGGLFILIGFLFYQNYSKSIQISQSGRDYEMNNSYCQVTNGDGSKWDGVVVLKGEKPNCVEGDFVSKPQLFTVIWRNFDGTILEYDDNLQPGTLPEYNGNIPTRVGAAGYDYKFIGWDKELKPVNMSTSYTAKYDKVDKKYTILWEDEDGNVIKTDSDLSYGTKISDIYFEPTKPSTAENDYFFNGWSPEVEDFVYNNMTYRATFRTSEKKFKVTWVNFNNEILEVDEGVKYGVTPEYNGIEPKRPDTNSQTFKFTGWTPIVSKVVTDTIYKATYEDRVKTFTVKWFDYKDSLIETFTNIPYGNTTKFTGTLPNPPAEVGWVYKFTGWEDKISGELNNFTILKDTSYKATYVKTKQEFTATWKNWDGSILLTNKVYYGDIPVYTIAEPTKPASPQNAYIFKGWSPSISVTTKDITYTAIYEEKERLYNVKWLNGDGSLLKEDSNLKYGSNIEYTWDESDLDEDKKWRPTKTSEYPEQYDYVFDYSWSPGVSNVTEDVSYTPNFIKVPVKYLITFDVEGSIVEEWVDYGEMPSYKLGEPTKPSTSEYTYTFIGWSPEISKVIKNQTYTATFRATKNTYLVQWKNWDGTILKSQELEYGQLPIAPASPTKPMTNTEIYTFNGWDKTISPVTGATTYTAQYNTSVRYYSITWKNWDGSILRNDSVQYNTSLTPPSASRANTAQYTYSFSGWSPAVVSVTRDQTYTAQFTATPVNYNITWKNWDGTTLRTDSVAYGSTPNYGETPTRPETTDYRYNFSGWSPAVTAVTGAQTYTAQFSPVSKWVYTTGSTYIGGYNDTNFGVGKGFAYSIPSNIQPQQIRVDTNLNQHVPTNQKTACMKVTVNGTLRQYCAWGTGNNGTSFYFDIPRNTTYVSFSINVNSFKHSVNAYLTQYYVKN